MSNWHRTMCRPAAKGKTIMNRLEERRLRRIIEESTLREIASLKKRKILGEQDDASLKNLDISKGPSETVAFLNGPGADKRVRALLRAGKDDGSPDDESAEISEGSATIGGLVPTQVEIELTKSIGYPLAKFDVMKKMIQPGVQKIGPKGNDMIVKSGNLIVDGHHRWSSLFSVAGPEGVIAAIDIALPEKDAASVLSIVQAAIATTLDGPVPKAKAGGMNILGKGKDEIAAMIRSAYESGSGEAGPILTDEYVMQCLSDSAVNKHFGLQDAGILGPKSPKEADAGKDSGSSGQKAESYDRGSVLFEKKSKLGKKYENRDKISAARTHIINFVANNLSQMNQPAEGSPPRVDMPQLDKAKGGVSGALNKLKAGEVNYKPPFAKESADHSGQVVLERWQRLAGLIK